MTRGPSNLVRRISSLKRSTTVDVPQSDEASRALRMMAGLEELGSTWFWETDREGRLTYLSPGVLRELDRRGDGLQGKPLAQLFERDESQGLHERNLSFHLRTRTSFKDLEIRSVGEVDRSWSLSGRSINDEDGSFRGFVGSGSNLTERRRTEAEVARLALSDSLTGLANRTRMQTALDHALSGRFSSPKPVVLMLLDLDRFKAVNDTLGHQTGDKLLIQVAERLRRAAGEAALVGRIGGDEFQVVIFEEDDRDQLREHARQIITSLSLPYLIAGASITIGCSIGIAVAPDDGDDAETLVRNADLALYAAKGSGRGVHKFYRAELLAQAQLRKQIEDDLRDALVNDELSLVYQPVVSTGSAMIVGYEALLRWTHPQRGPISPANFIPVAEESGLIESIGEWVLRTAIASAASWPGSVRVAINVSALQFSKPGFPALVANALAHSGLPPERLELEITESVFLGGAEATEPIFRSLKTLGVRLALDDFGTGYSSLGYLKAAPFDKIKIDQGFVRGARVPGSRNAAIIKAIVMLADALHMETTAEGVEAQDEIELIRELGCSQIQGFVYGHPLPHADVLQQLSARGAIEAIGVKVSRPTRVRMLRSIRIEVNGARLSARLRDVSFSGALIDRFAPLTLHPGSEFAIELVEGQFTPAIVRWTKDDRAGLELLKTVDFRKLSDSASRLPFGRSNTALSSQTG